MSNKPRLSREKNKQPGLLDRLLTAIFAPIIFNVSIIIVLTMGFHRTGSPGRFFIHQNFWSGFWVMLVAGILPAIAGFMLGSDKFATLLGHFFYTNLDHEKDIRTTLVCWLGIFAIAYLLSGAV